MLKTAIQRTPFNTDIANEFFQNIYGNKYMNDDVLVSVSRAILPQRMEEGDIIRFHYQPKHINIGRPFEGTTEECEAYISNDIDLSANNMVTIYYFNGVRREHSAQYMEAIQKHFVAKHRGWEENMKVRNEYNRYFPILAFANTAKRSVVIFMGEMNMQRQRCAILSVFASMPWYFADKGIPLTEDEIGLLLCLTSEEESEEESMQKFNTLMVHMAEKYEFDKIRIDKMLNGFESQYERRALENVRVAIQRNDRNIDSLNQQIREQLEQRRDNMIRLAGLQTRIGEIGEASALRDLFLSNPRLYLESADNDTMVFSVKTDLEYFDSDQLETYIRNPESCIYHGGGRISSDDMVKLMRAVFIDNTIRLQVCGCYEFDLSGRVEAISRHDFPTGFADYMPNTHINDYHCLGNHKPQINECLKNGDYVGAIMQCIASCQSLNFGDYTVMQSFMEHLYRNHYSGFRLPNGRVVKPSDAIAWLKEQEVRGEQEAQETTASAEA